jgi:sugar/nucleoside kinase (ribokinase family)
LPYIDYLKTDAAEAEILTGLTDRTEAAKLLYSWGAKEVLITHNTEVLAYDGEKIYTCPIKARNLSGRTGRGDTTFAGYITERQHASIEEALLYCTALVSLKMETPGPFMGTREDVLEYIREFY